MYCHMDADEFQWLFYNTFSENPCKNHRISIKISEDDWTVSDYLYHHFETKIRETMTCISFHQNKTPKILQENYFILSLDVISLNNKQTHIFNDKNIHLTKNCVTLAALLDKFNEKTELSNVTRKKNQQLMVKLVRPKTSVSIESTNATHNIPSMIRI